MTEMLFPVAVRRKPGGGFERIDRRNSGDVITMWIGNDDPVPEGWSLVGEIPSHHSLYGRLVSRPAG